MISEKIEALAQALGKYVRTGLMLEPAGVIHVEDVLNDLALQARRMEACVVPDGARTDLAALPDNVVRFTPRRAPGYAPPSGDAA